MYIRDGEREREDGTRSELSLLISVLCCVACVYRYIRAFCVYISTRFGVYAKIKEIELLRERRAAMAT